MRTSPRARRLRPLRLVATLCTVLVTATFAQLVAQEPAAAANTRKGIQAGEILNLGDCSYTDSGSLLLNDTELLSKTGWLRLDLRGAADLNGCARTKYVEFLQTMQNAGVKVIGLLGPGFAPADPTAFATAAAAIACDPTYADLVYAWEIWNEPNFLGAGTYLDPVTYASMLTQSSDLIHFCSQEAARVISGGVNGVDSQGTTPMAYLTQVSTAIRDNPLWQQHHAYVKIRDAVNGIGIHPYVAPLRSATDNVDTGLHPNLSAFVSQFTTSSEFEFAGEPVYITEFGWRRASGTDEAAPAGEEVTPDDQCYNLVAAFDHIANMTNVVAATWFTLKDWGDAGQRFGLYGETSQKKQAWLGYTKGDCDGVVAGLYNQNLQQLQWQDPVVAVAATAAKTASSSATESTSALATIYEIVLAPSNSPTYTMTRTTTSPYLPLSMLTPPLPIGIYVWRVIKIVDGLRYPGKEQWKFTFLGTPTPPGAGSAVAGADGTSITLTWTDNSIDETAFVVSDGAATNSTGKDATSYTWTGLAPGSYHCYQVQSGNNYGLSAPSGTMCATTPTAPTAPSGVTATVVTGTSVRIDWTDTSANETSFEVSDGTTTYSLAANTTSYTWGGIALGATKCFKVRSRNAVSFSAWAGAPCTTQPTIPIAPTTPTAAVASGTSIKVTWADKSSNEWGFEISNGTTSQVVGANTTTFTWGGLANGTYMCFRVRSYNLAGYSAWTAYSCNTTPTLPKAPTIQSATAISTSQITVKWLDNSANETKFELYNGVSTISLAANTTSYTWGGLAAGTYMCFAVRSYNLAGYSAWTPYACTTTPAPPAAPSSPTATAISTSQIKVTWLDKSSNETGFQIYDGVGYFTVGANATVFYRTGLATKTYKCFAIRSYNAYGYSAWTPYACTTTL
jgi:hypothetical protein